MSFFTIIEKRNYKCDSSSSVFGLILEAKSGFLSARFIACKKCVCTYSYFDMHFVTSVARLYIILMASKETAPYYSAIPERPVP